MITEQEVEKAAAYIRDNSKDYAKAKAERVYLHEFRKSQKALLINLYSAMAQEGGIKRTGQEHESYAYAHDDYIQVLEGLRAAVEEEERLRWMIVAAQTKIDIWRTEQANNRNIDRSHQ